MRGHYWTFRPFLASLAKPPRAAATQHFRVTLEDPRMGEVKVTGRLSEGGEDLVVVIHGLGGSHRSYYAVHAARAATRAGLSCLRLDLRGADRTGDDFYHAGLTADVHAALASPRLAKFRRIYLMGFSLGGHVALCTATETCDPRVQSVAAICPPMDLAAGVEVIDRPGGALYRRHVLRGLVDIFEQVARRGRPLPITPKEARRIRLIADWDERVVAPHHGFDGAKGYWRETSVGPRLGSLRVPALVVSAEEDPMVATRTVRPWVERADTVRAVFVARGGHVGFPPGTDLGLGESGEVDEQVIAWLRDPG